MQRRWERHEDAYQGKKQGSEKRTKARQQSSQDLKNKSRKKNRLVQSGSKFRIILHVWFQMVKLVRP